jgi:hypothetical protein
MTDLTGVIKEKMTRADILAVFEHDLRNEIERVQQQYEDKIEACRKRIETIGAELKRAQKAEEKKILVLARPLVKFLVGSCDLSVTFYDHVENDCEHYRTKRPRAYAWIVSKGTQTYSEDRVGFINLQMKEVSKATHWAHNCVAADVKVSRVYMAIRNKLVQERNRLNKEIGKIQTQNYELQRHLQKLPSKVKKFSAQLNKMILGKIPQGSEILSYTNQLTKKAMETLPEDIALNSKEGTTRSSRKTSSSRFKRRASIRIIKEN